jgi:hypothetical protein
VAGDDSINLEATHVALSRGTEANFLYYMGDGPPDEDHHLPEVAEPRFHGLVAAVGRSRAQVMALYLLAGVGSTAAPAVPAADWTEAPMTEAQQAVLVRNGRVPDTDHTWVEASLLIDDVMRTQRGDRARAWLRDGGASEAEAAKILEQAKERLRGRRASFGSQAQRDEREDLRQEESDSVRSRRRQRQAWARQTSAADDAAYRVVQTGRGATRGMR